MKPHHTPPHPTSNAPFMPNNNNNNNNNDNNNDNSNSNNVNNSQRWVLCVARSTTLADKWRSNLGRTRPSNSISNASDATVGRSRGAWRPLDLQQFTIYQESNANPNKTR